MSSKKNTTPEDKPEKAKGKAEKSSSTPPKKTAKPAEKPKTIKSAAKKEAPAPKKEAKPEKAPAAKTTKPAPKAAKPAPKQESEKAPPPPKAKKAAPKQEVPIIDSGMEAVIQTGGKQYHVLPRDYLDIELIKPLSSEKDDIEFQEVLLIKDKNKCHIGTPFVKGAFVKARVLGESLGNKVVSMKYKPRENQRKKFGHRQRYLQIQITEIGVK